MAHPVSHVDGRSGFPDGMAELQRAAVAAKERQGQLEQALQEALAAIQQLTTRAEVAERVAEGAKAAAHEAIDELQVVEGRLALAVKERDALKSILASHGKEERAMTSAAAQGIATSSGALNKSELLQLQECEAQLEEARKREMEMKEELKRAWDTADDHRSTMQSMQERLKASAAELRELQEIGEQMEKKVEFWEGRVAAGVFDPSYTKVLRMKVNPLLDTCSAHESVQLLHEVRSLHTPVMELQGQGRGGGDSIMSGAESEDQSQRREGGDGTQQEESSPTEREKDLAEKVAKLEKILSRYKKVVHSKISLFREACYSLFGWKVDMADRPNEKGIITTFFSLRSQFSANDDEALEFQVNNKKFEMLANAYTRTPELQAQVNTFLTRYGCIPAFTANLTMELFNQTTMS